MRQILLYIRNNREIFFILIIAAILRFFHLGYQSIWMDEIYTMNITNPKLSYGEMISEINIREGFPYLYFLVIKTLHHIFEFDPLVSRTFSAIAGLAGVFMIYLLGKRLFSRNAGIIAALLTAVSEYCIYSSQDGRPYTFYFFAVLLSFYTFIKFIKQPTLRHAIIYGLATALLLNTNFFSAINLFSQALIILFFLWISPAHQRVNLFKNAFIGGLLAVLLFLPNFKILAKLLEFKSNWIPLPTPDSFSLIFKELLGNSEMTLFIMIPLFFYFLFKTFEGKESVGFEETVNDKKAFAFIILSIWAIVVLGIILLKTYLDTSLLVSRYFISILPVFFLIFAAAIDWISNRYVRFIVLISLVGFMLANTFVVKHYYTSTSKTQFREAAAFVIDNNQTNEPVYTSLKYWYDHFFMEANVPYTIIERASLETVLNEMAVDSSKITPFWYVEAHGRPFVLTEQAQSFLDNNFYTENNYDGLDAWARHYIRIEDAPKSIDVSKFDLLKQADGDTFASSIEAFEDSENKITASGWAYFPEQTAKKSKISLMLVKGTETFLFNTQKITRADVTSYFNSKFDINDAGFSAAFNKETLSQGRYQIAIYIVNLETGKEGLMMTDKFISK